MSAGDSDAIDFQTWLTPAQALESLAGKWPDAEIRKRWIYRRLASGQIVSIAATFSHNRQVSTGEPTAIRPEFWADPWRQLDADFWETGDITITDEEPFVGVMILPDTTPMRPTNRMELFDVRFDPTAFPEVPVANSDDVVDPTGTDLPPLPTAETKRYLTVYLEAFGEQVTEGKALTATRAAYPKNSISREQFRELLRELRGPGKRGKPPIRG
ncbi:hypothetical protein MB02_07720 [Croceicoccus estronivorus]|uniref:hypothetical protein n=1 Tax=Croceicoccus estronivorus TaxID=1172626 RepID=UPI00082DF391|nr:hypothetical protein [Croceicoccus estronivorus]OCC24150.1 hypothetical protein MB02_07720 [Croceicoccus estronivorus]